MLNDGALVRALHAHLSDPGSPRSFSARRREYRWREFLSRFPSLDTMQVLDLGGTPDYWLNAPITPAQVTTVNLDPFEGAEGVTHIVGDACDPSLLDKVGDHDLVVSNSLLEHVGGHQRRRELAEVIREAAPCHWVQTPTRSFPVEPHYVCPLLHFLPLRWRAGVVRRWPLNHVPVDSRDEALAQVLGIELVSTAEMRHLFPDSDIWHERWLGLSKSIVAVQA